MEIQWNLDLVWQPQGPIELQGENACHLHNSFMEIQWNFDLVWQPQGPIELQGENACHHHNSFSFDQMQIMWTWIKSWAS